MSRNLIILFLSGKNKNLAPLPLRLGESCLKSLNQLGGARRLRVNAITHICLKNILITEGTKSLNTVKLGRQSGIESLTHWTTNGPAETAASIPQYPPNSCVPA
uniref:Uncharacterized protein n=2 Tax=Picea TaxID=3328 RepID=A0A117NJA4_PICGL|nr:hypothetical protein ABT39_MTgene1090 [Picea glauca]QHR89977.1 hypothetical protein Q903MT_gene3999 [Picea sitchensis]